MDISGLSGIMTNRHRRSRLLTAFHAGAVCLLVAMPVSAQIDRKRSNSFSVVRTFSLPNVPLSNFESELFRTTEGPASLADIVNLNLQFSDEHGKPSIVPPFFAPKTSTIVLRFPDGWLTLNMVRADGEGSYICRFKFKMVEPGPAKSDFDKYVDWCHGMLTATSLDPSLVTPP